MTDDASIEQFLYRDEGHVEGETVLTVGEREFVIVQTRGKVLPQVYELVPGDVRPTRIVETEDDE